MWLFKYLILSILLCNLVNCKTFGVINENSVDGELIFAHILFRHGDRTPIDLYPNDPYKDRKYWPEGYGQLTNIGKQQHYELGQFFRRRYEKLLGNDSYSADKIYIQSTDVDRTLMSAESDLAGLFPPNEEQLWNKEILWQPIPVHTTPEKLDYILAAKKKCPRYDYAMKKYIASPEMKALLEKFRPLMQYLEKNSGKPIRTFDDTLEIFNTLWIEDLKNKTLPDWTKTVYYTGSDMEWMAFHAFQLNTITPELARLKTGFLLRDILNRFEQKITGKLTPDRSLWIYSAHDITVANVLNSIGLFDPPHAPPYAATILFELHKNNGNYYMQMFYKNTTDDHLLPLNIPNCGVKCPLDAFYSVYSTIIPTKDFETECHLSMLYMTYEEISFSVYDAGYVTIACFAVSAMLIVFLAWKFMCRARNTKTYIQL